MGFFDKLINDPIGSIFDIAEEAVEKTVETVVRIPEIPIRATRATIKGVEKGIEKIEDSVDL